MLTARFMQEAHKCITQKVKRHIEGKVTNSVN